MALDKKYVTKHNKKDFDEICPNCGSENISIVTGWCMKHHTPEIDGFLVYCREPKECLGAVFGIKNAYYCMDCDFIFDNEEMVNWMEYGSGNCPVGEEDEFSDETIEEYTKKLYEFLTEYKEQKIDELVSQGHYLEAIGTLHIQISEQLRFLLTKRIKSHENIPINQNDIKYKRVMGIIKNMKEIELLKFSFVFGRIDDTEYQKLTFLNKIRNAFSHSFRERKKYTENQIKGIIGKVKKIERKLSKMVEDYKT